MSAETLTIEEAKAANLTLIEDGEKGGQAVHDLIVAYQANRRSGSANTKTRGEIRGSGKKMYRQKGTGAARKGNKKAVQLRGGGMAFAKKTRDYGYHMPKKARRAALAAAIRGLQEELGIEGIPLTRLIQFKMNYGPNDNEFSEVFSQSTQVFTPASLIASCKILTKSLSRREYEMKTRVLFRSALFFAACAAGIELCLVLSRAEIPAVNLSAKSVFCSSSSVKS